MDEILHIPQERETESLTARLRAKAQTAGDAIRVGAKRFQHWADAATAGGRRIISPFHFLAVAAVVGVAAVVTSVYTPAYVVEMNGVALGTVTSPQVFEDAVDRVEARATQILGYDYTLEESAVSYSTGLTARSAVEDAGELEGIGKDEPPALSPEQISERYPLFANSLFNLIRNTEARMGVSPQGKKDK